jgi:primosomal protein N' (replication factor Y)
MLSLRITNRRRAFIGRRNMTAPLFAEVAVNVPVRGERAGVEGEVSSVLTFHYHVPPGMDVQAGHLVWVSFGAQQAQGLVLALSQTSPVALTKPILAVCDPQPYLTSAHQALARWMASYFLCAVSDAAFLFLPPGIEQRSLTMVAALPDAAQAVDDLSADQRRIWDIVRQRRQVAVDQLRTATHMANARSVVEQLARRGLALTYQVILPPRVRPKIERTTWLIVDSERVHQEIARIHEPRLRRARLLRVLLDAGRPLPVADALAAANCPRADMSELHKKGLISLDPERGHVTIGADTAVVLEAFNEYAAPPQRGRAGLLAFLAQHNQPMSVTELIKVTGASSEQVRALAGDGIVQIEEREVRRDPLALRSYAPSHPPVLTAEQERAYQTLRADILQPLRVGQPPRPVLLHGVTGSGKTEIYLRALADVLAMGRQAIIMVPEISLTPQTIARFASRFPGNVAVLHSRLSLGEHFDEWRRIRDGLVDIVVGSRSAVFAPLPRLGLIVLDEEHEWTYKQSDAQPRYHARDVAIKLAELTGALVVMGSATPDVVSYHRALAGDYRLLELTERVVHAASAPASPGLTVVQSPLPPVDVVDLREELKAGNRSIFSRALRDAMQAALAAEEQVILFLNRRGTATFIMCRDCGHVLRCSSCAAPLGYHQDEEELVCHQCNRRYRVPSACPACWSKRIKYFGIGTQKVEEDVRTLFPSARTLRWDRDVTQGRLAHEMILDRFVRHEADVLIGTQMIAKGLDLPLVTLVGVISADTALHLPDLRAGERTFQLLTQVAGRAGRSARGGRVIVQTYTPDNYAVMAASRHDYAGFVALELAYRADRGYPPYSQLARLVLQEPDGERASTEAQRLYDVLSLRVAQQGMPDVKLLGPAPCFVARLRGRYRWQIIVQAADVHPVLANLTLPAGWAVDVDPISTL